MRTGFNKQFFFVIVGKDNVRMYDSAPAALQGAKDTGGTAYSTYLHSYDLYELNLKPVKQVKKWHRSLGA